MKKILLFAAAFLTLSTVVFADFSDVYPEDQYANSIGWLQSQGVVQGYADGTFHPYGEINRAEFLKMIYEGTGGIPTDMDLSGSASFPDVPADAWFTPYVKAAAVDGVAKGYDDGYFRPENPINRAEAMKIVMRKFFGDEPADFFEMLSVSDRDKIVGCEEDPHYLSDIEVGAWYEQYFYFAHSACLIPKGMIVDMAPPSEDLVHPGQNLTRGEMAELLYRSKSMADGATEAYYDGVAPDDVYELESVSIVNVGGEASCFEFELQYENGSAVDVPEEIKNTYGCQGGSMSVSPNSKFFSYDVWDGDHSILKTYNFMAKQIEKIVDIDAGAEGVTCQWSDDSSALGCVIVDQINYDASTKLLLVQFDAAGNVVRSADEEQVWGETVNYVCGSYCGSSDEDFTVNADSIVYQTNENMGDVQTVTWSPFE